MGKVEILQLIAGIVLSIAIALIVVPMFGKSKDLVTRHTIEREMIAVKDAMIILSKEDPIFLNGFTYPYFFDKIKKYIDLKQSKTESLYSSLSKDFRAHEGYGNFVVFNSFQFRKNHSWINNKYKHVGKFSFYDTSYEALELNKLFENNKNNLEKICNQDLTVHYGEIICYFYL